MNDPNARHPLNLARLEAERAHQSAQAAAKSLIGDSAAYARALREADVAYYRAIYWACAKHGSPVEDAFNALKSLGAQP